MCKRTLYPSGQPPSTERSAIGGVVMCEIRSRLALLRATAASWVIQRSRRLRDDKPRIARCTLARQLMARLIPPHVTFCAA